MKKVFYVSFNKADYLPWYLKFLDKDISHCYTLEAQLLGGYPCFIKIENLLNICETFIHMGNTADVLALYPSTKVRIVVDVKPTSKMNPFMPTTCVSITKKLLGISKPLIMTPKQLFNYLLKIGGEVI